MKSHHPKPLNVHPSANHQDQHDPGLPGPLQERNEMKKTTKPAVSASNTPARHPELKTIEKPKKKLSDAMARLKAANDAVDASFSAAEAHLETLGLEFDAYVNVGVREVTPEHTGEAELDYPTDIFEDAYLAYERVGERRRITIRKTRSSLVGNKIVTSSTVLNHVPWDHASQVEKIEALVLLPYLLAALAREVEDTAEVADENLATIHSLISRVS
jgi:hypothetical protein